MSLVTIIIPCFNLGRYLTQAVESIASQTHSNWECIIINDGSSDETDSIAKAWCSRDKRVRYISKPNGGLSSARNAGLRAATGKYIQFLDADDWLLPNKLACQVEALEKAPPNTIAICDHYTFWDETGEYMERCYMSPFLDAGAYKTEVVSEWEFRRSIPCHNVLVPKKLVDRHALCFYENLSNHEDWVFWCQLFFFAGGVCYQPEKMARYRVRDNSMVSNKPAMAIGFLDATYVLEGFYKTAKQPALIRAVQRLRKEIKNNLFPYSPPKKIYSAVARETKKIFGIER